MINIYVGNLNYDTTEQDLEEAFTPHGKVQEVRIICDESGRSKGFGFVRMPDRQQGINAISALDGAKLDGRTLKVNEAQSRKGGQRGSRR